MDPNIGCLIEYVGELFFVFVFILILIQGLRPIKSKTTGLRPS